MWASANSSEFEEQRNGANQEQCQEHDSLLAQRGSSEEPRQIRISIVGFIHYAKTLLFAHTTAR
jgi:hypothetical protein